MAIEQQAVMDFADVGFQVEIGSLRNVKEHLPLLYSTQQEDVCRAESWLRENKAYLFTNGTGTGKTFVGLGVISRFYARGLQSILIVVPTAKKAEDWIEDGQYMDLTIRQLDGINDARGNIIVTTYANFRANEALLVRDFDLVVYDECHYLGQNAQGDKTSSFDAHETIAKLPRRANALTHIDLGPYPDYESDPTRAKRNAWDENFDVIARGYWLSTKVLYLSATPFAYHKSIEYMDGTLWHFYQHVGNYESEHVGYNVPRGFEKFLVDRLGYRMKYNKCTIPETGVDVNLLERKLFEDSVKEGFMSTRQLFLDHDYSREFIHLGSEIGEKIDRGIELMRSREFEKDFKILAKYVSKHFNYLFTNQILEMIKAREIIPRIVKHLALDRKVIVFHSYNQGYISHPFRFNAEKLLKGTDERFFLVPKLEDEINRFYRTYPEYADMELDGLKNVRDTISEHFPDTSVEFNGTVAKGKRMKNVNAFMKDHGDVNIIVVQVKAGKEGISFHDTTGVHQRVLITLGLPTAPTDAIQIEGRIYREGVKSNAIYEYATLQTSFESSAFADKIATRSKTAENLAMGNLARDLENSFREGYQNYHTNEPHREQGFGGVEDDKDLRVENEFDMACTYYFMKQAKNAKTKSNMGIDWYATPEPLGLKMIQWLKLKDGDSFLEPSAGDGAIGRWASPLWNNKYVEASYKLASVLGLNVNGEVINDRFENFHIGNKFDGIAMNPPFGHQSKDAAEHVFKAANQLRHWGTLLAIVPAGPSFNKRWKTMLEDSPIYSQIFIRTMVKLPSCTFKRAGTGVMTNLLKIVRIPHHFEDKPERSDVSVIDLTWCDNVEMLFSQIEHLEL